MKSLKLFALTLISTITLSLSAQTQVYLKIDLEEAKTAEIEFVEVAGGGDFFQIGFASLIPVQVEKKDVTGAITHFIQVAPMKFTSPDGSSVIRFAPATFVPGSTGMYEIQAMLAVRN